MKTIKSIILTLGFILVLAISNQLMGQTVMGIIPVNYTPVSSSVLNAQQWQSVSLQMQDQFALQLTSIGNIKKLTREHILLLLKEVPAPDPESLNAEAYKIISKKEQLQYLLKCSIESIQVTDKNVIVPIRVIIVDGSNGKVFWEKPLKINKIVSNPALTEHILLNEVFKPSINDLSKEIKALKY
jgi:hypothetical protein